MEGEGGKMEGQREGDEVGRRWEEGRTGRERCREKVGRWKDRERGR